MDHLRLPQNPFSDYPISRLVCAAKGDDTGSISIPDLSTYAYAKATFLEHADEVPALSDAAPFLQAWLWFGLLRNIFEVVGVAFDYNDFIVEDRAHGHRLNTHALHRYLWYWVAAESRISDVERPRRARLINSFIDETFKALQCYTVKNAYFEPGVTQIQERRPFGPFIADDSSNVLLGIVVLAEALDFAQESVYRDFWEGQGRAWDEPLSIRVAMLEAGWCIKELARLTDQLTISHVTVLLFLSRMNRHTLGKDHSHCSLELCAHENIDYSTYRPAHTLTECPCEEITPSYDSSKRLDHALCQRNIPLLKFRRDSLIGPRLEVEIYSSRTRHTPYVAISHVWSDKMGNLVENALPKCQLQRMQEQVNSLYPERCDTIPFWIDTICVPRERTTRTMAIKSMRQVYELADKVLVLDSSLRILSSTIAPEDLLLRILVAPWSTRLWTYHEGALARKIYFQLSECALNGDAIEKTYMSQHSASADTVQVEHLLPGTVENELNRALVRAMSLSLKDEIFLDLQEEAEKPVLVPSSSELTNNVEFPQANTETDSDEEQEQQEDEETSHDEGESIAWPESSELERINEYILASDARTREINERTARKREETRQLLEEVARKREGTRRLLDEAAAKRAEAEAWTLKVEQMRLNNLGGIVHRQLPQKSLCLNIPAAWLEQPPEPCDHALAGMIKNLDHNHDMPKFWLRAFDPILQEGLNSYYNLRTAFKRLSLNMQTSPVPRAGQISEIISALRWRTTSWAGDEAICFAIILGMDVETVQKAQPKDRMITLASMWQEVPTELAFCNLQRMSRPGFAWMPQSILGMGLNSAGTM